MGKKKSDTGLTAEEKWAGLLWLALELFVLPRALGLANGALSKPLSHAALNVVFFSLNFVAAVVIFRGYLLRSLFAAGRGFSAFLQAVLLGFFACWAGNFLVSLAVARLIPAFANPNDAAITQMGQGNFWLTAIGTVLLVPTAEECFHRGLVFRGLHEKSPAAAYCVSTLLFCTIHVAGYLTTGDFLVCLGAFCQYIPAGLCLAWACEKSGGILAPILIHTAINAIGIYTVR